MLYHENLRENKAKELFDEALERQKPDHFVLNGGVDAKLRRAHSNHERLVKEK